MPALPPGMTASGAERTGGPSTAGQGSGPEGAAGLAGKPTKQAPPPIRTEAEKQLIASGLDVDQLASDAFKPEDCELSQDRLHLLNPTDCCSYGALDSP